MRRKTFNPPLFFVALVIAVWLGPVTAQADEQVGVEDLVVSGGVSTRFMAIWRLSPVFG
jgi:hypothetical protein